ncbi:MAG: hypothetical protein LUI05_02225 [Oscillospiraceae bacterium]|nr:hypothetical protein [Oscillospiraceae bacterium]
MNENEIVTTALDQHEQEILIQCRIQAQSFKEVGRLLKIIDDGEEYKLKGFATFKAYMDSAYNTVFPFGYSQACKYIRVYEHYGARLEQFSGMPLEILDMFKDDNIEDFEKIAKENDLEHKSVAEAKKLKARLDKAEEQLTMLNDDLTAAENNITAIEQDKRAAEQQVKELTAAVEKLTEKKDVEINALNDRIKELTTEAENIKAGYEAKLALAKTESTAADERLKAMQSQLDKATSKADEQVIKIKFYFEEMQSSAKSFAAALSDISDSERKAKYQGAAVKFLNAVAEEIGNVQKDD